MTQVVIILYFLSLIASLFFRSKGEGQGLSDYVLAGRKLSLIPFVATLVTTAYGWIFGIGELYYQLGISAWLFLSLPYTLFSLLIAFGLGKGLQMHRVNSIPELLNKQFGKYVSLLGALAVLVFISPLMYVHMTASLLEYSLEIGFMTCVVLALAFSTIYLYKGGFAVLSKNDSIKFLIMFGGFIAAAIYLFYNHGPTLKTELPASFLYFDIDAELWTMLTWLLLASMVLADPSFHQRIYAAKDPAIAKKGMLIAIGFWTLFDFLAASVALFGAALVPELEQADTVYLVLADQYLPELLAAFLNLGLLATIMSTADSYLFLSAQTLAVDLLGFRRYPQRAIRLSLFVISLTCLGLLYLYQGETVVSIFLDFTPYVVSVLVLPVLMALSKNWRMDQVWVLVQMSLALTACALSQAYPFVINGTTLSPVFAGLGTSLFILVMIKLMHPKAFHGKSA